MRQPEYVGSSMVALVRVSYFTEVARPALLLWAGVHVVRSFTGLLAWVNPLDLDFLPQAGLLAGLWIIGLLGWFFSRPDRVRGLGLLFAALYAASHALAGPALTPVLASAALVAWLWLLPAAVGDLYARGYGRLLAPAVLIGLAGQVALQTATHGLDLPMMRGWTAGLIALGLGGSLLALCWAAPSGEVSGERPGWRIAGLGPYLVLQLVLLCNLGQVSIWSGWGIAGSATLIVGALAGAGLMLTWAPPAWVRVLLGLAAIGLLTQPALGIWLVPVVQLSLVPVLSALVEPVRAGGGSGAGVVAAIGSFLGLALYLEYGTRPEWPELWLAMAGLGLLPALAFLRPVARVRMGWTAAVVALGLIGIGVALIPRGGGPTERPAPTELTVMTYNIHEAYRSDGVPDPEAIARTVAEANPDLVSLQEVARGMDLIGGADLVPWLRWRFPEYRIVYAGAYGERMGHVIMSRYPVLESGRVRLPLKVGTEPRALNWARIQTEGGDLLFMGTHLSAWEKEGPDRIAQAEAILDVWGRAPRTILAGDLNETPGEPALLKLDGAGLVDLVARAGSGDQPTHPAGAPAIRIDYIYGTPDIEVVSAEVGKTQASDHLPVVAKVRLLK